MDLAGMENKKEKKSKTTTIILIFIILLVLLIIGIIVSMLIVQKVTLKVYIDGQIVTLPKNTIIQDNESGKIYVAIKEIAPYLGYEAHNGEYKIFSEDENKCWINNKKETASFFLNSDKVSKVYPDQTLDYENYRIDEAVIKKNGKLYVTPEGIKIGFNSTFTYNKENNTININTLPNLVKTYNTRMQKYGYTGVSTEFDNQKAILYNLFIVKKKDGLYGVVNSNNTEIISSKYKSMSFNETTQEFFVKSTTDKVGIVTATGETKINLLYDNITLLDKNSDLYVVKNENKYGVIDGNGNNVIYAEYDKIGITSGNFPADNISNRYLLFDNFIPVYKNEKWGAFNKSGEMILPLEYDFMGYSYSKANNKAVNPLLIIPKYNAIVLGKTNKEERKNYYGIFDSEGNQMVPVRLTNAYSLTNAGVNTYYMTYEENEINIEEYMERYVVQN